MEDREQALPTTEEPVVCATSGHRIRIMFASAATYTPTAAQAAGIRSIVRRMNSKVLSESVRSSGSTRALKMRVECDANEDITILGFRSSGHPEEVLYTPDIFGAPTGANAVKNLVFYDGLDPTDPNVGGYGRIYDDDDKSSSDVYEIFGSGNFNRTVSASAVVYHNPSFVWSYWDRHVALHELFHTLGAVNSDAPSSTSQNHCIDGLDVMCYPDEYFANILYNERLCPADNYFDTPLGLPLDCTYNTYFDAGEEGGEWLNAHWNTAGIENPFLVQAPTPRAPTVATRPASHSLTTNVTLSGTVNPNGLSTQYRFEYGLTTAYGTNVPYPDGNLTWNLYTDAPVAHTFAGLQPGTTYHFRLVATNARGTTYGPDQTFTTPVWRIMTTLNPAGASNSYLYTVGCEPSSTNLCTAVGKTASAGVDAPVAQRWDGTSWSLQTPALKSGATHTRLFGVECPSTTRCIAVGNSETSGSGTATLAELWNEGRWLIQSTPVPAGAISSELTDVGCNSTANCSAVGSAVISGVKTAISERWTSPAWTLETIPIPAGATSSQLDGVDCLWSNFCVAVGRYTTSSSIRSLAMFWNGTSWSLQTPTEPVGATESTLLDISCTPSPNICTAVGGWKSGSQQFTLAYRFNGSTWTLQSTPNPSGSIASVLQDVSCATTTSCTAVGSWVSGSGGSNRTLAEQWDGSNWSIQSTSDPLGAGFSALFGASCRGTSCLAVGWRTNSTGAASTLGEVR